MNWELLWLFIVLNVLNVIIQTVKSIATIKCGKWSAAVVNAIAYGLYTIVVVYTVCDLNLWLKVAVVAVANLVGVYVVKLFEEKTRKDKLWKVEATIPYTLTSNLHHELEKNAIAHNYITNVGSYSIFNIYCPSQEVSIAVRSALEKVGAKYFVSESKTL
jgi:uncharacterized protein YebE (UPF0316 family)